MRYENMHAYQIGYDNYKNRRDWLRHHYTGVDEQAYDRGCQAAMQEAREASNTQHNRSNRVMTKGRLLSDCMPMADYRAAITRRFIALGRDGANINLRHPGRKQWERLRSEIFADVEEAREALRVHGIRLPE